MRKGGQGQWRGKEAEPGCRGVEIFLSTGEETTRFVGCLEGAKRQEGLELQGSERKRCTKAGGSIRAGPKAQEEGWSSLLLYL